MVHFILRYCHTELWNTTAEYTLAPSVTVIHMEGLDKMEKTPAAIMEDLLEVHQVRSPRWNPPSALTPDTPDTPDQ